MRTAAWMTALACIIAPIGNLEVRCQPANPQSTLSKVLDLIRGHGSDGQLEAGLTKILGYAPNQRGTWDYHQVGAFANEGDPSSALHIYAIHDESDTDVLVFTRVGPVAHFIRASRDGKVLAAAAFDNNEGKRLELTPANAQTEVNAELDFWSKNAEKTGYWSDCMAELGGAHAVKSDVKIAACEWVASHERNNKRAVSLAYTNLGLAVGHDDEKKEMEYLRRAVDTDPGNDSAWAQLCSAQNWVTHDSKAALASCTKVIELAPKSAEGWTYRGDIYLSDKKYSEAISDYNHAIELNPQWMWPWDNRGEAYLRMGKPYQAILDFNEVIKTGPDYAMGYLDRGIAHLKLNELDAAKADFAAGLKIDPKCGHCLVGRGLVALQLGDKPAGEADIAQGKKLSPKAAEAFAEDGITIP